MSKLIFMFILLFSQCDSLTQVDVDICMQNNVKSSELISQFYLNNNTLYLDSALFYIDEIYHKCDSLTELLSLRKLSIFSLTKDYSKALLFINTFGEDSFGELIYFKGFLLYRFNAMQSQNNGNIDKRNYYLKLIVIEIEDFLVSNEEKVNHLFNLSEVEEIAENPLSTSIIQYYYYKALLEGEDNVKSELTLRENLKGGNKEFYEMILSILNEDFMIFSGF